MMKNEVRGPLRIGPLTLDSKLLIRGNDFEQFHIAVLQGGNGHPSMGLVVIIEADWPHALIKIIQFLEALPDRIRIHLPAQFDCLGQGLQTGVGNPTV